ncbi:MAG: hypothetical protein V3T77_10085, partial [Planctomycetota bacterium]
LMAPLLRLGWPIQFLMRKSLELMRAWLFKRKPTRVEITTLAHRMGDVTTASVEVDDGFLATAYVVSAALELLDSRQISPGCYLPDQLFGFAEIVETVEKQAGSQLRIQVHEAPGAAQAYLA